MGGQAVSVQNRKMEIAKRSATEPSQLKNIAEVTTESSTINESRPPIRVEVKTADEKPKNISWWRRYTNCVELVTRLCLRGKGKKSQFEVNEQDMTKQVEKLKRKKTSEALLPPLKNPNGKTLVLDLDETLVHTTFKKPRHYDHVLEVEVRGRKQRAYMSKRFGLDVFLFEMAQVYEIVLFTAGVKEYTDEVLGLIDPKKRISHVLYRNSCTVLNRSYFLKNLRSLGRDLKQVVLVDDNSMAGMLNPECYVKIDPFLGSSRDRKLLRMGEFLKEMAREESMDSLSQKKHNFDRRNAPPSSLVNHRLSSKHAMLKSELSNCTQSTAQEGNTNLELVRSVDV